MIVDYNQLSSWWSKISNEFSFTNSFGAHLITKCRHTSLLLHRRDIIKPKLRWTDQISIYLKNANSRMIEKINTATTNERKNNPLQFHVFKRISNSRGAHPARTLLPIFSRLISPDDSPERKLPGAPHLLKKQLPTSPRQRARHHTTCRVFRLHRTLQSNVYVYNIIHADCSKLKVKRSRRASGSAWRKLHSGFLGRNRGYGATAFTPARPAAAATGGLFNAFRAEPLCNGI